jgi:hypothetical protein
VSYPNQKRRRRRRRRKKRKKDDDDILIFTDILGKYFDDCTKALVIIRLIKPDHLLEKIYDLLAAPSSVATAGWHEQGQDKGKDLRVR